LSRLNRALNIVGWLIVLATSAFCVLSDDDGWARALVLEAIGAFALLSGNLVSRWFKNKLIIVGVQAFAGLVCTVLWVATIVLLRHLVHGPVVS